MINIAGNDITDIAVGSTPIEKAYIGSTLVWEKSTPALPYDAQVEWLESTGTQYVQLPLSVSAQTFFEVEFDIIIDTLYTNRNNAIFGGNPWKQCNASYYSNSTGIAGFSSYLGNATTNGGISIAIGGKTHVIFSTTQIRSYTEDEDMTNRSVSRPLSGAMTAFRIFRGYRYTNEYPCKMCNFKITAGDSLVYDLIAVRKDGVGYMYDKVSGELFGNLGTGSFGIGNDVT